MENMHHTPVLLKETLDILDPKPGEDTIDATLGLAGHALAFLEKTSPNGRLIGLDADEQNLTEAKKRLQNYSSRITLHHQNFRYLADTVSHPVDIIFADLGLSSPHVDDAERGFSFRFDGPLDLRFDRSKGIPAHEWLTKQTEASLANTLREFGELKNAMRLARILKSRPVVTTIDVVECVQECVGHRSKHFLPQVFQALRIAVNNELSSLNALLQTAPALLKPGGRIAIMSYHSLEDRFVKQAFRALATPAKDPITGQEEENHPYTLVVRKPIVPTDAEIKANPRARSAKLRVLCKQH